MKLKFNHKVFNNILAGFVVLLGLYIAVGPFWPNIELWVSSTFSSNDGYAYSGQLAELSGVDVGEQADIPEENTLLIPAIQLDQKVLEGQNIDIIANGETWRRPDSSTPDAGGNTVIVGHRWGYNNDTTFYHLDKMAVGEKFSIYWDKQEYVYEVTENKVVPATQIDIEAPSNEAKLTLYTCTPLWTAKDRLVVVSKLISSPEDRI